MDRVKEAQLVRATLVPQLDHWPDETRITLEVLGMKHRFVVRDDKIQHVESHNQDEVIHLMDGAMDRNGRLHTKSGL